RRVACGAGGDPGVTAALLRAAAVPAPPAIRDDSLTDAERRDRFPAVPRRRDGTMAVTSPAAAQGVAAVVVAGTRSGICRGLRAVVQDGLRRHGRCVPPRARLADVTGGTGCASITDVILPHGSEAAPDSVRTAAAGDRVGGVVV